MSNYMKKGSLKTSVILFAVGLATELLEVLIRFLKFYEQTIYNQSSSRNFGVTVITFMPSFLAFGYYLIKKYSRVKLFNNIVNTVIHFSYVFITVCIGIFAVLINVLLYYLLISGLPLFPPQH